MNKNEYRISEFIFNESFRKFIFKESEEDILYWSSWLRRNPEAYDLVNQAQEILTVIRDQKRQPRYDEDKERVYNNLQDMIRLSDISHNKKRRIPVKQLFRYAATIAILVSVFFTWKVYKEKSGYTKTDKFLEVFVPEGQRSHLILPDGTKVWLNSGTYFKYPVDFMGKTREVRVEGEAYFDVRHNETLPFIVWIRDDLFINVLGTEFNVKSYDNENIIETTLIEGALKFIRQDNNNNIIEEHLLQPKEKVIYQKENQEIRIIDLSADTETVINNFSKNLVNANTEFGEVESITAWKNEQLVFYNETFDEIVRRLERWYGVDITVTDENLKQERFTGKFVNNESIYQILDIFNRSESIQYTSKNKEIIIKKKSTNNLKPVPME